MRMRFPTLVAIVACVAAITSSALAAGGGATTIAAGMCAGVGPVAGPWDVYEDMFTADAPTWLPAHTHMGIECTLGVRGTTMWWFSGSGKRPIPSGTALYTKPGRVHTAGNDGPAPMAYFATHVLVAGSPYRTLVADPTAPAQVSTHGKSLFHSIFANQKVFANRYARTFAAVLKIISVPPGANIGMERGSLLSDGMLYYTVISGKVMAGSTIYGRYGKFTGPRGFTNPGPDVAILGVVRILPSR